MRYEPHQHPKRLAASSLQVSGRILQNQTGNIEFLGSFHEHPPLLELPEVAFVGRSNVGKSSALNRLMGRKAAARVSSRPGRTQAINLFRIGSACVFADLPGYGYAKVPEAVQDAWRGTIEAYLRGRDRLRLVVLLVDARREPQELDGQLLYALTTMRIPSCVVATKVDKLKKRERRDQLDAIRKEFRLADNQPVPFSAVSGEGKDMVWKRIEAACRKGGA